MTGAPIPPIESPVLATHPEEMRGLVESVSSQMRQGANWMVRKKVMLDALSAFEAMASMSEEEREALFAVVRERLVAEDPELAAATDKTLEAIDEQGDEGIEEEDFVPSPAMLLLVMCGAVLETLGETEVRSAEQAAIYALSIHPAHNQAAVDWAQSDPHNARAMRKLVRHDRRFARIFDAVSALVPAEGLDDDPGVLPPP